ncbi:MAG TPA: PQQ-dependent sugar dehydrogenase [Burkholderiales bacterium]
MKQHACSARAGTRAIPFLSSLLVFSFAVVALPAFSADCPPLEKREANVPEQKPAFEGQTRACGVQTERAIAVDVVAKGLDKPWAVEPLPGGGWLVTEKTGQLRHVAKEGEVGNPVKGVPPVDARRQGGLLDVELSPSFAADRLIYWSYTERRKGGNATSVARGKLAMNHRSLSDVEVIFRAEPAYDGTKHFGSRLVFGRDGMLFITLGERSEDVMRPQAQQFNSHMGKVIRIRPDGSVPHDNPFIGTTAALPEIWTLGHRNVQSAAIDASGKLWIVEHGTKGGDEINLIEKGRNYGWVIAAYGEEYSGKPIETAETWREGTVQPVYYWDPNIAPSGAQFHSGKAFPEWRGNLFIGGLKDRDLVRVVIQDDKVTGEERLLADRGQRIRDVKEGPDGFLYVVTDGGDLWRVKPHK